MNASKQLEKVQLASSIYDYIAAGVFAFPIIASWYFINVLSETHALFGSIGSYPEFSPFHVLFANLFGGFAIMWSTLRIIKRLPVFGLCDGLLRCYYGTIMLLYILFWQLSSLLYLFVAIEFFWGSWQLILYFSAKKQSVMNNEQLV